MTTVKDTSHKKNKIAWQLAKEIEELTKNDNQKVFEIGKRLTQIKEEKLYRYIGEGGYTTMNDFLNNAEIGVSYSTANLWIGLYRFYIKHLNYEPDELMQTPQYRLQKLMPRLRNIETDKAKQIVEEVTYMPTQDYLDLLKDLGVISKKKPKLYKCEVCGKWKPTVELCTCDHDDKK